MEINIEITRDDFVDFNKYVIKKRNRNGKIFIFNLILALLLPFLVQIKKPFNPVDYFAGVVFLFALFTLIFVIFWNIEKFGFRKLPDKKGVILGERTILLTDQGFVEITRTTSQTTKWDAVLSVEETRDHIFVFVDKTAAYLIPKRYFRDDQDVYSFIENIRRRISE